MIICSSATKVLRRTHEGMRFEEGEDEAAPT